jgi:hypothetical protein
MRLVETSPTRCIEWFVVANLAFLGADILVAHDANAFARRVEWLPIGYSMLAPLALLPGVLRRGRPSVTRTIDLVVAFGAIVVGVLGMVFHLASAFFAERTLRSLVYSAPFVAPIAYVGVGLLLLLVRLERPDSRAVGEWSMLLALGGFGGNLVLSLLDHAQNSFFRATEWIPVVAAAYGCSFLFVALVRRSRPILKACLGVCAVEALVGVLGFAFHAVADARGPSVSIAARIVFGAPVFAPLLFTNLSLLAALAVWTLLNWEASEARRPAE